MDPDATDVAGGFSWNPTSYEVGDQLTVTFDEAYAAGTTPTVLIQARNRQAITINPFLASVTSSDFTIESTVADDTGGESEFYYHVTAVGPNTTI